MSASSSPGSSSSDRQRGRRVKGLRVGWAAVGATLPGLVGHATLSVGFDGGRGQVYSSVSRSGVAWV